MTAFDPERACFSLLLSALAIFLYSSVARGQTDPSSEPGLVCVETGGTLVEDFTDVQFKDVEATSAAGWPGAISLARKGNTFDDTVDRFGVRAFALGDGDFDGDGFNDMVALVLSPNCHLHLLKNERTGAGAFDGFSPGGVPGDSDYEAQRIFAPEICDTAGPAILAGDYDGDGDRDFIYLNVDDEDNSGRLEVALYFENRLVPDGIPPNQAHNFATPTRILSEFRGGEFEPMAHSTTKYFDVVDWNNDGFDDVVFTSTSGTEGVDRRALLFRSLGDGKFRRGFSLIEGTGLEGSEESKVDVDGGVAENCGGTGLDVTAVAARDFDGDEAVDLILGSASDGKLRHWRNDGTDRFTRLPDIAFPEGSAIFILGADFDGDGDEDLVVGRDGWLCGEANGQVFYFDNDGEGNFSRRTRPIINTGIDLDLGIAFDIDGDEQSTPDLIAADGEESGVYSRILSEKTDFYNLRGSARSLTYAPLTDQQAFTSVQVKVDHRTPPGTDWRFLVSNNDGLSWEEIPRGKLDGGSDDLFNFTNFGSKLRWRIDLMAEEYTPRSDEQIFAPLSRNSPIIERVTLNYFFEERRLYSRSGLALAKNVELSNDQTRDVLYASAFHYPGYEGFLFAYDVEDFVGDPDGTTFSIVNEDPSVRILWEAGEELRARDSASRSIYTALALDADGVRNDRVSFVVANSETLSKDMLLNVEEAEEVIGFVREGMVHREGWKFYDPGHSSPVFVGVPDENPDAPPFSDMNYRAFVESETDRNPRVYIASNSGMIHAFDAATGAEAWAFIPNNLLGRLKAQLHKSDAGDPSYDHQFLIDGRLMVHDIFDGSQWRTVLISGQAKGRGRDDNNYYFALDVTDPDDPIPLWEFTDPWDNELEECTGENPIIERQETCTRSCNSSCTGNGHIFTESPESPGRVLIEAENFNSTTTIDTIHRWVADTKCPNGSDAVSEGACVRAVPSRGGGPCDDSLLSCGAQMVYEFALVSPGKYYVDARMFAEREDGNSIAIQIDGRGEGFLDVAADQGWGWFRDPNAFDLDAGDHTLAVYMREEGTTIDKFAVTRSGPIADQSFGAVQQCLERCSRVCSTNDVSVQLDDSSEWPECGVGDNERCCLGREINLCHPVGQRCPKVKTATGETWSQPAVGRARIGGQGRFLAFFGSGYGNLPTAPDTVGRSVYAIDAITGELIKQWEFDDIPSGPGNPSTIAMTIPGSVALADVLGRGGSGTGADGFVDRVYVGDLEGRLWKIELDADGALVDGRIADNQWPACVLFDAGDPDPSDGSGRTWAPVITKPAVAFPDSASRFPHVYFGTGGDDNVPDVLGNGDPGIQQRFYAVRDDQNCRAPFDTAALVTLDDLAIEELEWIVGDGLEVDRRTPLDPSDAEGTIQDRYWADPVVLDDTVVFFASLPGKIESVNPCEVFDNESHFYAYAARDFYDADEARMIRAGTSIFAGQIPYLAADSQIRRAVVLDNEGSDSVVARAETRRNIPSRSVDSIDVFVQEFAAVDSERPNIRSISTQNIGTRAAAIRVIRWREIGVEP